MNTPKVINHWGKWINSEEPTTGVLNLNEIELDYFLSDDEICLTCDEMMEQEEQENPENPDYDWIECDSSHTKLHGDWILDTITGLYKPDKQGEFAAIENEFTVQVVWSKYTKRGNPCSPCYPGQVEFSNDGDFLAYTLPDDMLYNE